MIRGLDLLNELIGVDEPRRAILEEVARPRVLGRALGARLADEDGEDDFEVALAPSTFGDHAEVRRLQPVQPEPLAQALRAGVGGYARVRVTSHHPALS